MDLEGKYGDNKWVDRYNTYKQDLIKAKKLLEEAVYFINQVPNKKYKTSTGETSYELASKIDKYLNNIK